MLVQLGKRAASQDVVDLLSDCHGRIRRFLVLSKQLAASPGITASEACEIAAQIRRYFTTAFPMHVADEEELIEPQLRGGDVDAALTTMRADHTEHAPLVSRMIGLCEDIERDPRQLAARSAELADVSDRLALALEAHLSLEERVIFPALCGLPSQQREAIRDAMRARRESAHSIHR